MYFFWYFSRNIFAIYRFFMFVWLVHLVVGFFFYWTRVFLTTYRFLLMPTCSSWLLVPWTQLCPGISNDDHDDDHDNDNNCDDDDDAGVDVDTASLLNSMLSSSPTSKAWPKSMILMSSFCCNCQHICIYLYIYIYLWWWWWWGNSNWRVKVKSKIIKSGKVRVKEWEWKFCHHQQNHGQCSHLVAEKNVVRFHIKMDDSKVMEKGQAL